MNFDFLKNLRGLGNIYENCNNAEKLAMTMPAQSMLTARKSAESLAKFIYLAAHNEQMEFMNFVDILGDPAVRNFIHDRKVMNAFHFIRKSGNRTAHSDEIETAEEAVDVLEELHFVAGETACKLGLINNYPEFEPDIDSFPEEKYIAVEDVDKKAREMFCAYVEEYNAQIERDNYYKEKIDCLMEKFESFQSLLKVIPGDVDLNETIEFSSRPKSESSLKPIQAYFGFMGIRAMKYSRGELYGDLEDCELKFTGKLTIYGEDGYSTSDLTEFVYGVMYDLPSADGFKIESTYFGPSVAPCFESDRKKEFPEEIAEIGQSENFTYKIFKCLYNHGTGYTAKYENGKWIKLEDRYLPDIIDKDFGSEWWCWGLDLAVEFDYEKQADILAALHSAVRKNVPKSELEYCEKNWEDGEVGILCPSIYWGPNKLREIQNFLDELNEILKPIMNEYEGDCEGTWFIKEEPFAVATWNWTKDGFKIIGTEL